jgi:RNA polymerase sigma factor (sigma-70 family)
MPRALLGDGHLSRLAARGDRRAFEAIFERYHQELYRYCRAILGDPDEAQDALQSTMASALRALPGDRRQIALRPWLYRVAHNEAISILRQRQPTLDPDRLPEPQAPGVHVEAETRERLRALVVDLEHLPERQRGALVMRELSGLSYAEIGAALTASEAAARQTVYEARAALRELQGGREMQCESARQAISERDGRVLRGRSLRAHLRTCEPCRNFRMAISQRRSDLRSICPPLPGLAASGLLAAVLGEAGSAGGAAAAGAAAAGGAGVAGGTALAGSAAVKGASIAAALVIAAGAADVSGVANLPLVGDGGAPATSTAGQGASAHETAGATGELSGRSRAGRDSGPAHGGASRGKPGRGHRGSAGAGNGGAHGRPASAPHGKPQSTREAGTLPATSRGTPPAHSQAGGAPSSGRAGASSPHGGPPASRPGPANPSAGSPTPPEQSSGKPDSPAERSSAPGASASSGHGKPDSA